MDEKPCRNGAVCGNLTSQIFQQPGQACAASRVPTLSAYATKMGRSLIRALLLGAHPAVQQPLHRALCGRRRDRLIAVPGRRIVDDDIGLPGQVGLETSPSY